MFFFYDSFFIVFHFFFSRCVYNNFSKCIVKIIHVSFPFKMLIFYEKEKCFSLKIFRLYFFTFSPSILVVLLNFFFVLKVVGSDERVRCGIKWKKVLEFRCDCTRFLWSRLNVRGLSCEIDIWRVLNFSISFLAKISPFSKSTSPHPPPNQIKTQERKEYKRKKEDWKRKMCCLWL